MLTDVDRSLSNCTLFFNASAKSFMKKKFLKIIKTYFYDILTVGKANT